jgi:cytochrome d ubiquinol oxidase subunit II
LAWAYYFSWREAHGRDVLINTIAPVWDGNETWLVLGGACLYGVFPIAYGTLLPALYPPLVAMLLGLIFRGVAFEFRFKVNSQRQRSLWDLLLFAGSTVAAAMQGIILGALIQGIKVQNNQYAGGWFDWLTAFSVFCGFAVVIGYALLGACWLVWRTNGELQSRARRYAKPLLHHDRPCGNCLTMANVAHSELNEIACPKFAVDGQIEQS